MTKVPAPPALPDARDDTSAYSISFVCLGNICRSPTAQVVMTQRLAEAGIEHQVRVRSGGTGTWHIGEPMDRRAAATLLARGYDPSRPRATAVEPSWVERDDLVLVMDTENLRDVVALAEVAADHDRIMMFRAFDPLAEGTLDVPDPWSGGQDDFDQVLAIVERTCDVLVGALTARLADQESDALPRPPQR